MKKARAAQNDTDLMYIMHVEDAVNETTHACGEWKFKLRPQTWLLTKFVGDRSAAVALDDIANTIDGGTNAMSAAKAQSLMGACGTNGGQMGITVDQRNLVYRSKAFLDGNYTTSGIIIKLVHNPGHSY